MRTGTDVGKSSTVGPQRQDGHPLPAEDLALKGGERETVSQSLRFLGKEPRASILQENRGGREVCSGAGKGLQEQSKGGGRAGSQTCRGLTS